MNEPATPPTPHAVRPRGGSGRYPMSAPQWTAPQPEWVVSSERTRALFELVRQVAPHDVTTLITGETGTGKELVAQTLHRASPRADRPFVPINCATLQPQLVCATLFGHERGAFTGADARRNGVFATAHGGTVFLDEVGELDAAAQCALLRVLETGRYRPVGAMEETACDVRVIAATHRDLQARTREGLFRLDLYYRLNAIGLDVPPLRERVEEVKPLAEHFLRVFTERHDVRRRELSPAVVRALESHHWPGNVRELRNVIERAAILAQGTLFELDDLPERLRERTLPSVATACQCGASAGLREPAGSAAGPRTFRQAIQAYERQLIEDALASTQGNRARAAQRLGMPRRTLLNKLRTLGLDDR